MFQRNYNLFDKVVIWGEQALGALTQAPKAARPSPAINLPEPKLSLVEKVLVANLLRVDHAGEVCAQALYLGHALTARNPAIKKHMHKAAQEEVDHLAWCAYRLHELSDHVSYLNPLWYLGSFAIGALSGLMGEAWNLGFVAETEHQVEAHLEGHLMILPQQDEKSRQILLQMKADEIIHADQALAAGGRELPFVVKKAMKLLSKVMTTAAFYI